MKLKEPLRDFSLTLVFLAGIIVFLNFPHLSTLVFFVSIVMVILGLAMLVSPRKSPKILGILELLVLFVEKRKHSGWGVKLIRLVGSGLISAGLLFFAFVYNRIYKFTNDLYIVVVVLVVFVVFAAAENYLVSYYRKKKL